jgi:hypothetical protein
MCATFVRWFKQGSALFARMQKAAFEFERELVRSRIPRFKVDEFVPQIWHVNL